MAPRGRIVVALYVLIATFAEQGRAERYAVVVGVNECPNFRLPNGAKPRPLRGAENDADAMRQVLIEQFGFDRRHVVLLQGKNATHAGLKAAFERVGRQASRDDVLIFHFSGHGTQLADVRPLDESDDLDEGLCTYDATADGKNVVRDDELSLWLDDIPARQITVILDCCHAGTGTKDPDDEFVAKYLPVSATPRVIGRREEQWRELRSNTKSLSRELTAFYACRANQQAYERRVYNPTRRVGQFTFYLLQGLRNQVADRDGNGAISHSEALKYATSKLDRDFNAHREDIGLKQHPFLETDHDEDPIFGAVIPLH